MIFSNSEGYHMVTATHSLTEAITTRLDIEAGQGDISAPAVMSQKIGNIDLVPINLKHLAENVEDVIIHLCNTSGEVIASATMDLQNITQGVSPSGKVNIPHYTLFEYLQMQNPEAQLPVLGVYIQLSFVVSVNPVATSYQHYVELLFAKAELTFQRALVSGTQEALIASITDILNGNLHNYNGVLPVSV